MKKEKFFSSKKAKKPLTDAEKADKIIKLLTAEVENLNYRIQTKTQEEENTNNQGSFGRQKAKLDQMVLKMKGYFDKEAKRVHKIIKLLTAEIEHLNDKITIQSKIDALEGKINNESTPKKKIEKLQKKLKNESKKMTAVDGELQTINK